MNSQLRAAALIGTLLLSAIGTIYSQGTDTNDKLRRADSQFDLYAYFTALNSYTDVLKADPNNAYAHGRVADCYVQLNRPMDALPWYDRAMQLGRVDPEITLRYAQALMHTGDYVGAKRWFSSYSQTNPAVGQHFMAMCDQAPQLQKNTGGYNVQNEMINSNSSEFAPGFYGNRVIFCSANKEIRRKSPKGDVNTGTNEVFISQRNNDDGLLQRPGFLIGDLEKSPTANEGPVAYAANGTRVAFNYNKFIDGSRQIAAKGIEMGLWIAEVNADGKWSAPKPFQYNGSDYANGFPCLSDDGNTLYFASNMPGGLGGWDLYISTYNNNTQQWSVPRNMGATVNTQGNEITPYITGTTLYFSSDWHGGIGGMDVFKADFQNNYASNIVNLGGAVNSPRDDYGFIWDNGQKLGYVVSNRSEGRGNEDIWKVSANADEFVITVRDQYQQPVPDAEIDFSACGKNVTMRTDEAGKYAFKLASGKVNCTITVRKYGYPSGTGLLNSYGEHNITVVLGGSSSATPPAPNSYNWPGGQPPTGTVANGNWVTKTPTDNYSQQPTTVTSITGNHELTGLVINATNNAPLPFVRILAEPISGNLINSETSTQGLYFMALEPNNTYKLTYSLIGFSDVATTVATGQAGQITQMKAIPMTPGQGTVSMNGLPPLTSGDPILKSPTSQPATSPEYSTPTNYNMPPAAATIDGYSIQLASTPGDIPVSKLTGYDHLTTYGNLYTKPEGRNTRVRLGVFPTKDAANAVLAKIKKKQKDAFVIQETGADAILAVTPVFEEPSQKPSEYGLVSPQKTPDTSGDQAYNAPTKQKDPVAMPSTTKFAVQVASMSIAEPLIINQFNDLSQYGNVYTRPENEWNRVRVGVWTSQREAELAHAHIMALGYNDAVVIVEKSGTNMPAAKELSTQPAPTTTPTPTGTIPKSTPKAPAATPVTIGSSSAADLPPLDGSAPIVYGPTTKTKMAPIKPDPSGTVYMVRICSLTSDPTKFNVKKAEQAGGAVDARISESGATIMLLTNLADLESAQAAKERLVSLGFKDAMVVKEFSGDGILRKAE
jgi:cell division septation protein DedD/tetratricopeptide (TPR) repeat protein